MKDKATHPHPRRAKRAKMIARGVAVLGLITMGYGFLYFVDVMNSYGGGWPVAAVPLGATAILLSAIWYFSYMEQLEPELYEHDA